jgi:DNA helicase-2/ATP-dependent DNA helicase PcrA
LPSERSATNFETHRAIVPEADLGHRTSDESAFLAFAVGSRVRHPEFGRGKIMEKSGTGDSLKVVVLFDNGEWKKLLVKYASLEKI